MGIRDQQVKPGVVASTCNFSICVAEAELQASLGYIVTSCLEKGSEERTGERRVHVAHV